MDVLVTGSSRGFGDVIARTLAKAGYRVFAAMRGVDGGNHDAAKALKTWADAEHAALEVVEMDVADDASVERAADSIRSLGAAVEVIVNNAGISSRGPLEAFEIGQMQALYDVNVFGPLRVNKAFLPAMRERRSGLIVQISSTLGRVLPFHGGLYPASKWAVEGLAESLAYELRPFGIDVVILEPGAFPTTATARGLEAADQDLAGVYAAASPPRKRASANGPAPDLQEVADEVLRLVGVAPGERPLRTVVGPIFTEGIAEYNEEYERYRSRLRESLDWPDQSVTWR